jgi:hypothetical protein
MIKLHLLLLKERFWSLRRVEILAKSAPAGTVNSGDNAWFRRRRLQRLGKTVFKLDGEYM